jgi:uncharacterized repeat protein (TIGR01451 family)/uncharacterized delta-60 repeat protein
LTLALSPLAFADAGALDQSFNGTGVVKTADTGSAQGMAIDSSGRILVAGTAYKTGTGNYDFLLVRYLPNGQLDTSFGPDHNGKVTTDFGSHEYGSGVAIDSQGRIVMVGSQVFSNGTRWRMVVARYTPDGALDATFYGSGQRGVLFDIAGDDDTFGFAVAIDSQNRIILAGKVDDGNDDFFVVRLNSDGREDWKHSIAFGGNDAAYSVTIDPQGRIVVAGDSYDGSASVLPYGKFALARLNDDGSLDNTFDGDGKLESAFGNAFDSSAHGVAIDGVGRIVAGGYAGFKDYGGTQANGVGVARYNDDGTLDQSFGSGGRVIYYTDVQIQSDGASSVAFDHAGRIVLGATSGYYGAAVLRLTDQGALDSSFNAQGKFPGWRLINFGSAGSEAASDGAGTAVAIDAQGKIVLAGFMGQSPNSGEVGVARLYSDPSADLRISKNVSPSSAVPGDTVTYTISVTNLGPDSANNVQVNDVLPGDLTFVSCSASNGGVCTGSGNSRVVDYTALASSSIITIQATLNSGVADGATISNTATVTSTSPVDPDTSNNSASASFSVHNRSDLLLTQSVTKLNNRQLAYTLRVKNLGPYDARLIVLNNPMPNGTTFLNVSNGSWTCTPLPVGSVGTLVCTLPSLSSSGATEATVLFNVKVKAPGSVNITNTATVSAATYDPNLANNSAVLVTRVSGK